MKYAEFIIDSYKIEFFNSLFGNEKILVNKIEVSNKFSFFGTKHNFDLDSDQFILNSSFKALGKRELDLKLKKNEKLIKDLNIDLNPNYKIHWGALIIIFGIIIFSYLKG
ncbi:hypothetical protein [Gillisia sp. JM1]|uniref:hypothetical protein n=1 Tax=Gillisia sp. JM1 TaxID=1283286 RepID=UPI000428F424|nr:hypothetical protein [Gillisia sp. JM1]